MKPDYDPNNHYSKKGIRKEPSSFAASEASLSAFKQDYNLDYINEALPKALPKALPIKTILQPSASRSQSSSAHLKMSVRLPKGIVTSLTIKKNIIAIWLLYTIDPDKLHTNIIECADCADETPQEVLTPKQIKQDKDIISKEITDFVYRCLDSWKKETGKGLSDFITEMMIADFMDDYELYEKLLPLI